MGECKVTHMNRGDDYRGLWRCWTHEVHWATPGLGRPPACPVAAHVAAAVAEEREACAATVEGMANYYRELARKEPASSSAAAWLEASGDLDDAVDAIKARGKEADGG